jgi:cysteine desulfurase
LILVFVFDQMLRYLSQRYLPIFSRAYSSNTIQTDIPSPNQAFRPLYLDMQATTPLDPRVLDAMMPLETEQFGNAHSRTHAYGWESEELVENARSHIANLISASPKEIIFTSGATESNNAIIKGVARFYKEKKNHIITTQIEHKCVLDSCRQLQQEGFDVTYLPVQTNGIVDLNVLQNAIRPETVLVSVIAVNNEIGVRQPIEQIGEICESKGVFFHSDVAQMAGKLPIDMNKLKCHLLSLSGHKLYGPKGIGAIYIRRRPRVRLEPIISGGGQERGLRSGTLPVPLIVGFGKAAEIAKDEMEADNKHIIRLFQKLREGICSVLPDVYLNGDAEQRYHGNLNLSFAYVEGESLLMGLKDIACSSGSACTSQSLEPSYVLRALGVNEELAHTSIRFGIGRFTTDEEVEYTIQSVIKHVQKLRELSPLWEMVQEGIDLKTIKWTQDH